MGQLKRRPWARSHLIIPRLHTYLQAITAQAIALSNERNDVDILRRRMDASVLLIETPGGWNVANLPKL